MYVISIYSKIVLLVFEADTMVFLFPSFSQYLNEIHLLFEAWFCWEFSVFLIFEIWGWKFGCIVHFKEVKNKPFYLLIFGLFYGFHYMFLRSEFSSIIKIYMCLLHKAQCVFRISCFYNSNLFCAITIVQQSSQSPHASYQSSFYLPQSKMLEGNKADKRLEGMSY